MWQFTDSIPTERGKRLNSYSGFDTVAALIANDAQVIGFTWEPFNSARLLGCHRASFLLKVSEHVYDAFFNSPAGYRGQFARNPETGEEANRALLSKLEHLLLAHPSSEQQTFGPLVLQSLRAADAKCWIFEDEVQRHMGSITPEILYPSWQTASQDGAGLLAPLGTLIEVKGGWLDAQGVERRDPIKSSRSREIHDVGYS